MDKFNIEVFVKDKEDPIDSIAIGIREKGQHINYILTHGVTENENTVLEKIYPTSRIKHILVTNLSKLAKKHG